MYKKSNIARQIMTIVCIGIFALTSVPLIPDEASADRRDGRRGRYSREYRDRDRRIVKAPRHARWKKKRHIVTGHRHRHRRWYSSQPWRYRKPWYKRRPYYYYGGVSYRSPRFGFAFVGPPVGAIVVNIPLGYETVWIDDSMYYIYGGTYYRRIPEGYVVVNPPARVVVRDYKPVLVQPAIPASGQVFVDAPVLNVRSGPGLTEPKIYQVDEGYVLEIHGRSDGWLYVKLQNGEYGWVKEVFTKPVEPASG